MLQIDLVYEFMYKTLFKDFRLMCTSSGIFEPNNVSNIIVFTTSKYNTKKIFFYDQEPLVEKIYENYLNIVKNHGISTNKNILVTSEISDITKNFSSTVEFIPLYYFFHGYAALDWYRGFHALNYDKKPKIEYEYDYVTFNRLINDDRSYRCYFVSMLVENNLLENGQISFGLSTGYRSWQEEIQAKNSKLSNHAKNHIDKYISTINTPLIIDSDNIPGYASADIPRCIDNSFWHIVTETVFYYDKLHLTEKIFKPIAMKQPFMLLAAPGNLAYLKSYGFKTFNNIIDESYDTIQDPDDRIDAVVKQLHWYCNLSPKEKTEIIKEVAPIVEYNFHHFYGEFKHIITSELLDNCKVLFKEIGYDDSNIAYGDIYKVLTS